MSSIRCIDPVAYVSENRLPQACCLESEDATLNPRTRQSVGYLQGHWARQRAAHLASHRETSGMHDVTADDGSLDAVRDRQPGCMHTCSQSPIGYAQ